VSIRIGQYSRGKCVKPSAQAMGKYGNHIPKAMMDKVVMVNDRLAQL